MTIAAAYLTSEGVVLGADSTSTWTLTPNAAPGAPAQPAIHQHFNHAQKVFEVGIPGRVGLCTWGAGMVGTIPHRTLAALLGDHVDATNCTVEAAADELTQWVLAEWKARPTSFARLGYFVGGRDPGTRRPRCFEITFDNAAVGSKREVPTGECWFAGQNDFFCRVFQGCSQSLQELVKKELKTDLPPAMHGDIDAKFGGAWDRARAKLASMGATDVPIRDAIDYVHACLHLTIKAFKFRVGPPVCGGPIEVGFVTTDRPFRWASHKSFSTAIDEGQKHDERR